MSVIVLYVLLRVIKLYLVYAILSHHEAMYCTLNYHNLIHNLMQLKLAGTILDVCGY